MIKKENNNKTMYVCITEYQGYSDNFSVTFFVKLLSVNAINNTLFRKCVTNRIKIVQFFKMTKILNKK